MDMSFKACTSMDSDTGMNMDMRLKACSTTALKGDGDGDVCYQNDNYSDSKKQLLVYQKKKKKQLLVYQKKKKKQLLVDRLSGLPDELLIRILSLLPTKDAAVASLQSKRLRPIFPLITTLDIADTPVSNPEECPSKLQQFPSFANFVDTVLQAHQSQYLTSFRLGFGSDVTNINRVKCRKYCLPHVNATRIHSWISFPLTRCGLKELDLRIYVREPAHGHQLPPEIFTCETLEVLKLDVNFPVHQVSTFRLPTLKVLYLDVSYIHEDGLHFLSRLVSSCPSLEDLTVLAVLVRVQSLIVSSPSLRLLHLEIETHDVDNTDFMSIDTPNLEYLYYFCNIALQQSITNMDRLTKADIVMCDLAMEPEVSCQQILGFIRSLPNVHHLSLRNRSLELLSIDALKDQLPMFRNLKCLEVGAHGANDWDALVEILKCSPVLETLVFPEGMTVLSEDVNLRPSEYELCRTGLASIPCCCRFHLKRILIKNCYGNKREIGLIQLLLKHALVLEELVISRFKDRVPRCPIVDKVEHQKTLQNLTRASVTCSIQVD